MIFNIYLHDTYKTHTCHSVTKTGVDLEDPNGFTMMPLIVGMIYMAILVFWFPYICLFISNSKKEDDDPELLSRIGYYLKCFNCCYKTIPVMMKLMHYLILLLCIVQFALLKTDTACTDMRYTTKA